jgi:signal transduction histidine kinase
MPARRPGRRLSLLALALVVVCVTAGLIVGDHLARHALDVGGAGTSAAEIWRDRIVLWVCALGALAALIIALVHERSQARRIADRSDELERLSAELLRANRAKSEFLANVSHELRTPLAAVVGFIDLLRDGAYGELSARQAGPVERIETSANHLRELVDQILDLSKLAAGRLEVSTESLSLRAFVIDVASEVESLLNEKGLAFSIAVPATLPKVDTDPTHLRQILVNLLGNAIKFTEQGTITVRALRVPDGEVAQMAGRSRRRPLLAEGGAFIALQVSDTGTGIAERDQERIFEEFEQVNAGPRGDSIRRGTGLGLSISRRLARLLGGDITVESDLGSGATFTVWLPLDLVEPHPAISR